MIKLHNSGRVVESLISDELTKRIADPYRTKVLEQWLGKNNGGVTYEMSLLQEAFGADDFNAITTDQINTSLMKGFNGIDPEWIKLVPPSAQVSTNDFVRPQVKIDVGSTGLLDKVSPGQAGDSTKPGDKKLSYTVSMYERNISLFFEFFNSSNFANFLNIPTKLGNGARETIEDLIFNKILLGDNGGGFNTSTFSFDDASAARVLYDANNSLGASKALTETNLQDALKLMAEKTDMDNRRVSWRPKYLVCGLSNTINARKILNSTATTVVNENSGVVNPFANVLTPIITNFITDSKWFVVADPSVHDVIELAFFNGFKDPVITQEPTTSTRELKWSVRLGMGAAPLNPDSFVGANF